MTRVLLIGTLPPPVGGVSIHLNRFIRTENKNILLSLVDFKKKSVIYDKKEYPVNVVISFFIKADIVHIHISSKVKLLGALISRFFRKKTIYTHHNNIISTLEKKILFLLFHHIIFVNDKCLSDEEKLKYKKKFSIIPAFIPDVEKHELPKQLVEELKNYEIIISTNCYKLNYTSDNQETYGFDIIIKAFNILANTYKIENLLIIFLDPSKTYYELMSKYNSTQYKRNNRIMYLPETGISFSELLKRSTISVRATRTDGDSLSIRESLYFGVPVIASDVVERPNGCILFNNLDPIDLAFKINEAVKSSKTKNNTTSNKVDFSNELFKLYDFLVK